MAIAFAPQPRWTNAAVATVNVTQPAPPGSPNQVQAAAAAAATYPTQSLTIMDFDTSALAPVPDLQGDMYSEATGLVEDPTVQNLLATQAALKQSEVMTSFQATGVKAVADEMKDVARRIDSV